MICPNCGEQLADEARFCTNCGTKMEGEAQPVQAPVIETPVQSVQAPAVETPKPAPKKKKGVMVAIAIYSLLTLLIGAFTEFESGFLIASLVGIVPSILLLIFIYRMDSVEREPLKLIFKLFFGGGILSLIIALVLEIVLGFILNAIFGVTDEDALEWMSTSTLIIYQLIDNIICVALIEEFAKYFILKKFTWKHPAFDYRFDGVVYAVATAIGFEVFENIEYIFASGIGSLSTAFLRASFPGHAIFGLYMGYYYGKAKSLELGGNVKGAKRLRIAGLLIATVIHGLYDFLCSFNTLVFFLGVVPMVVLLNLFAFRNIRKYQSEDTAI